MNLSSAFPRSAIEKWHASLDSRRGSLLVQAIALALLTVILASILSERMGLLLLGVIMAGICALCIMRWPHWGLLVIIATWFIKVDVIGVRYFSIPYLVTALLFIPFALTIMHERTIWVLRVPQIKIFLAIGVLFLLSTWWSEIMYPVTLFPELDETARKSQLFITRLAFLVFFLYFMRSRQKIELTVWLVVGLIAITAISGSLPLLTGKATGRAAAAFSLGENENRLAYICLFGTSLLWFYRSDAQRPRWKFLTLPLLFLLPVTAITTGSRSGFLQLLVLAVLILKEQKGWVPAKRLRSIFLLGCVGLLLILAVPAAQLARVTSFNPNVRAPGHKSLQHRIDKIYYAAEMIAANPILGVGIGNIGWFISAFHASVGDPHNSYLSTLAEGGILVLALYLVLFYVTYRMLTELERAGPRELLWVSKGLRVNLILFLIFTAFADFWLSYFLYLIVGLTTATTYLWQERARRS